MQTYQYKYEKYYHKYHKNQIAGSKIIPIDLSDDTEMEMIDNIKYIKQIKDLLLNINENVLTSNKIKDLALQIVTLIQNHFLKPDSGADDLLAKTEQIFDFLYTNSKLIGSEIRDLFCYIIFILEDTYNYEYSQNKSELTLSQKFYDILFTDKDILLYGSDKKEKSV